MYTYKTNQIMSWGASKASDHARAPLEVSYEMIERKQRMASGTMRKYFVAHKRTWSTSWEMLPTQVGEVVDGGMTGPQMEAFWLANTQPFVLTLRDGQGVTETYNVFLSEFSKEIIKRGPANDYWNLNVTLEEK